MYLLCSKHLGVNDEGEASLCLMASLLGRGLDGRQVDRAAGCPAGAPSSGSRGSEGQGTEDLVRGSSGGYSDGAEKVSRSQSLGSVTVFPYRARRALQV